MDANSPIIGKIHFIAEAPRKKKRPRTMAEEHKEVLRKY